MMSIAQNQYYKICTEEILYVKNVDTILYLIWMYEGQKIQNILKKKYKYKNTIYLFTTIKYENS